MKRLDHQTFGRAHLYTGWDDDAATTIDRIAFLNVLTGVVMGFVAGAAAVGLWVLS
jgi:hypothetical protein